MTNRFVEFIGNYVLISLLLWLLFGVGYGITSALKFLGVDLLGEMSVGVLAFIWLLLVQLVIAPIYSALAGRRGDQKEGSSFLLSALGEFFGEIF